MTKQQYEAKRAEIFAQLVALDQQYVSENTTIEPGSVVKIEASGLKGYLKKYKVVGGYIYPIIHKLRKDGSYYQNERINVSKGVKLVRV